MRLKLRLKPLQTKRNLAFLFIWIKAKIGIFRSVLIVRYRKLLLLNIYTSVYDIKLKDYIDLVVDNKHKAIKKLKFIFTPKSVLLESISHLNEQYYDLSNDKGLKAVIGNTERMNSIVDKIYIYTLVLSTIKTKMKLASFGEIVNYDNILDFFYINRIKTTDISRGYNIIESNIVSLKSEYESLKSKIPTGKESRKPTRKDFSNWIITLNSNGLKADYNMSVGDYILTINSYFNKIEELNKQATR